LRQPAALRTLAFALPFALAALSNLRILDGQLGDDEAAQLTACTDILHRLAHGNLFGVVKVLSEVDQPPLRYLLSLPGLAIAPETGFGLRLGSVLVSLAMTYALVRLGRELAGDLVGWCAGLLVAASGAYNLTSTAFGWSVIVLALVQSIRVLRGAGLDLTERPERRRFAVVNAWLALAFVTNTGLILVTATVLALYAVRNRHAPRAAASAFAPWLGFYAAYYLYFFVLVQWAGHRFFDKHGKFGQLAHLWGRPGRGRLNVTDLLHGLQALNAHFLPFVGWGLLAASILYLARRERVVLLCLAPYTLAWAFYLHVETEQYFVLPVIATIPFGVAWVFSRLGRARGAAAVAAVAALFSGWNLALLVASYPEDAYPRGVLTTTYSRVVFQSNLFQPYPAIARDLDRVLPPGERWLNGVSGGLGEYYSNPDRSEFFDPRLAGRLGAAEFPLERAGGCLAVRLPPQSQVRAVVTKLRLCPRQIARTIRYRESDIRLYVLRA
jgi:hypothetical protein